MTIDDSGPAFPSGDGQYCGGPNHAYGMTLRDYFAGQALVGLLASNGDTRFLSHYAETAYTIADSMIEHRKSKP